MEARIELLFDSADEDAWAAMQELGEYLNKGKGSVEVYTVDAESGWLGVACTMRTEVQYKAVEKIEFALDVYGGDWTDSTIYFPKSEAERARAHRKQERRRAQRGAPNRGVT